MSSKISILAFAILSVLVLSSFASALVTLSSSSVQLSASQTSKNVALTIPTGVTASISSATPVTLTDSAGKTVVLSAILAGSNLAISSTADSLLKFGVYSTSFSIFAVNSTNASINESISLPVSYSKGFCKSGEVGGNLSIDSVDISSDGDEDLEWKPLDTVTVEVTVNNDGNDDLKDITVVLGLINDDGKDKISDMSFVSADEEEINLGTIKDGDDQTATFEFKVPADFNFDDGSSYKLVVKAYSDKSGESKECVDTSSDLEQDIYQEISIDRQDDEDKFIAFDQIELSATEATCGDRISLSATAYNVGDSDQDDVVIYLDNKALGVALQTEIKNGLETDEDADVVFEFTVPQNLKDGVYYLELTSDYEDGSTTDDPAVVALKVIGCQSVVPVTNQTTTPTETETEESASSFWGSVKGAFQGNGLIWTVAIINILLVIVIILVAVRIARR